jgi:Tol biopolymer transport system component
MKGLLRLFALVLLMLVVILTYARRENSGAWIAVFSNPDDAPGIFLMSGDGRSIRRILPHIIYGRKLDWSPDGRWLTYSEFIDNHNELRLMTIDGNEWRTLSTAPYYFGTVAWSPDSAWLAGVSSVSEERALYVFPINGESARLLGEQYVYPLWSPDGQWIYAAYATQDIIRIDRIHSLHHK